MGAGRLKSARWASRDEPGLVMMGFRFFPFYDSSSTADKGRIWSFVTSQIPPLAGHNTPLFRNYFPLIFMSVMTV